MTSRQGIEIPFIKVEDINVVKAGTGKGRCRNRCLWTDESVLSQRVRAQKSVLADVSIHIHWQRNLMKDILDESFLISSSLVSQAVRTTALKAEENDVGIKGGMTVECNHDDCIQLWCMCKSMPRGCT